MNATNKIETNAAKCRGHRAPLYCRYSGQTSPQPGRITIDPRDGSIEADYRPEVGPGQPMTEWHRLVLTLSVSPYVKGDVLADLIESDEFQDLARIVVDGHSIEWDGNNHVGRLTETGEEARERLQALCDDLDESDLAQVWEVGDWLSPGTYHDPNGEWVEIGEWRITAATTDEELAAIAAKLLAEADDEDIILTGDVETYLKNERDRCEPVESEE